MTTLVCHSPCLKQPARALAPGRAANLQVEEAKSLSGWSGIGILGALATATNFTSSLNNQRLLAISS